MHPIARRWAPRGVVMIDAAFALAGCGGCGEDHGCVELPVTGAQIAVLQDSDPRCGN